MPISQRSRMPATATHSLSTSASPSRPPSSPTSSTASTTPRSTFPPSREADLPSYLESKEHDHDYAFQHRSKSAYPRAAQVRPARRGSRLSYRPGLDGDHVLILRLPEVVSVRVRTTGPVHQQRAADLVAVSVVRPRRRQLFPERLGVDVRDPAARGLLGQAARRSRRAWLDRDLHPDGYGHSVHAGRLGRRRGRLPCDDR